MLQKFVGYIMVPDQFCHQWTVVICFSSTHCIQLYTNFCIFFWPISTRHIQLTTEISKFSDWNIFIFRINIQIVFRTFCVFQALEPGWPIQSPIATSDITVVLQQCTSASWSECCDCVTYGKIECWVGQPRIRRI